MKAGLTNGSSTSRQTKANRHLMSWNITGLALLQGQQAVRRIHKLPVHRLQKAGFPLQRIAYGNQYRKGRMQKDGNTVFHLILQVNDTQCLYA